MDETQIEMGKDCSCQIERKQIRTKAFSFWKVRTCSLEFGMSLLERTELLICIEGEGNTDGKGKGC